MLHCSIAILPHLLLILFAAELMSENRIANLWTYNCESMFDLIMALYPTGLLHPQTGAKHCRAWLVLAVLAVAFFLLAHSAAWAIPKGNARIAVDANTGEVLVARGSLTQWYPASLTKLMTLYLLFEAIEDGKTKWSDTITVSRHAALQPPSRLGVGQGGRILVRDAVQALAVKSANDIAVAVAEHVSGTEAKFIQRMNQTAKRLGLDRTTFRNPHGLHHSQQVTTARDMAMLAVIMMRDYPQYYRYFSQTRFRYGKRIYTNTNRMLGNYPGMDGLKTGYIFKAGFNLAASAKRGTRRVVAVVMGANSTAQRTLIMRSVLNQAFERLQSSGRKQITSALSVRLLAPSIIPRPRPDGPGAGVVVAQATSAPPAASGATATPPPMPPSPPERVVASVPVPPPAPGTEMEDIGSSSGADDSGSGFSVQVGAYLSKQEAQRHLVSVVSTLPKKLGTFDPHVTHYRNRNSRVLYRARLTGFDTREDAARTCDWLKNQSTDCLIVSLRP